MPVNEVILSICVITLAITECATACGICTSKDMNVKQNPKTSNNMNPHSTIITRQPTNTITTTSKTERPTH